VRRAAAAGHAAAHFIQPTFADSGTFGVERSVTAAAEWWVRINPSPNPNPNLTLTLTLTTLTLTRARWAKAADGNSPYAQLWLATLYANGKGCG